MTRVRASTSARPRLAISSRMTSRSVSPASAREISTVARIAASVRSSSSRSPVTSRSRLAFSIAIAAQSASTPTASSSSAVNSAPPTLSVR